MLPVATAGSGVYGTEIAYNAQVVSVNATTPLAFAANVEYLYGNNANHSQMYHSTTQAKLPAWKLFRSTYSSIAH